ncbi:MAG: hypothetical protein ACR2LI_12455 [Propionibacteriaceae bacterium]
MAPALLGALLGQPCRSPDLGPGRAAGAGETDGVGDAGVEVALLMQELLEADVRTLRKLVAS